MGFNVFISHSVMDIGIVLEISNTLRETGIDTYIAKEDIQAGESVPDKIEKHIEGSDCVLAILTKEGTRSDTVNQEIGYAKKGKKLIVPLVEKGKRVGALLQGVEYIRFDPADPREAMHKVITYIKNLKLSKDQRKVLITCAVVAVGLIAVGVAAGAIAAKSGKQSNAVTVGV